MTPVVHPGWCSPDECNVDGRRGSHLSRRTVIADERQQLELFLLQPVWPDVPPRLLVESRLADYVAAMLEIDPTDNDPHELLILPLDVAGQLATALGRLIESAVAP